MITLEHATAYFLSLTEKERTWRYYDVMEEFRKEIPFVLLPDAIRAYVGPRQASHFEVTTDGTDVSWMTFPSAEVLRTLTKENTSSKVKYFVADCPKCAIGNETSLHKYMEYNAEHPHYKSMFIHFIQDRFLDKLLREIVDCSGKSVDSFVVYHKGERIEFDGKELRSQLSKFAQLGFIHLVGMVYQQTGVLLNRNWFDTNVYGSLMKAYPEDLAACTYKYMRISDELDARINMLDFELSEDEKESVFITENLLDTLEYLYNGVLSEIKQFAAD